MSKGALAKKNTETAVALANDFAQYAGAGQTGHVEDYSIPFLSIIQSGSPQVKRGKAEYNEDAEPGFILNTVTAEIVDGEEGITVIPVAFQKCFIEWKPRDSGGGLVAIHDRVEGTKLEATATRNDKNKMILPNGNILETTAQHYVLVVREDGSIDRAILAMTSTQLKKSRKWMTMMSKVTVKSGGKIFNAPTFACAYKVTTVPESNNQGDWFGWKIEYAELGADKQPVLIQDAELFNQAKNFYDAVSKGEVRASEPAPEAEGAQASSASKVM